MKRIFLLTCFLFIAVMAFSQRFMHGAGVTVMVGSSKTGDVSYAEGLTYSPRFNVIETEQLSGSVGIPLSVAISASVSSTYSSSGYYDGGTSVGFVVNAPLIVNLNMGRGSTRDNEKKFGYFVGAGFGFHHGNFLVEDYYYGVTNSTTTNAYGPAANAGVRIGVGSAHRNIEIRASYMKGINEDKPNVYGLACLFNF
jgi:hypothetical protein